MKRETKYSSNNIPFKTKIKVSPTMQEILYKFYVTKFGFTVYSTGYDKYSNSMDKIQKYLEHCGIEYKPSVYILSKINGTSDEYKQHIQNYVDKLKGLGYDVYSPNVDTNQRADKLEINHSNISAIERADEVHVFYNVTSLGSHFDLGAAISNFKPIILVERANNDEEGYMPFLNLYKELF